MLNTVIFAGAVTIISVFFDSLAAYGLSRVNFKGRGLLLGVLIATMMIPGMALLIPVYKLLANMGLINSYWGIIIPRMADVGGIFLLRQSSSPFRRTSTTRPASMAQANSASSRRSSCRTRCRPSSPWACSTSWATGTICSGR